MLQLIFLFQVIIGCGRVGDRIVGDTNIVFTNKELPILIEEFVSDDSLYANFNTKFLTFYFYKNMGDTILNIVSSSYLPPRNFIGTGEIAGYKVLVYCEFGQEVVGVFKFSQKITEPPNLGIGDGYFEKYYIVKDKGRFLKSISIQSF